MDLTVFDSLLLPKIIDDLVARHWSVCERFLPDDSVQQLVREADEFWRDGSFTPAGVGQGENFKIRPEIRGDHVWWWDAEKLSPAQKNYGDAIESLRLKLNQEVFLSLRDFEAHYTVYSAGTFYKKHLDQFRATTQRVISCIFYLNQEWQSSYGGQLRIYDAARPESFTDILPVAGTFVCFRSDTIYHEVLPATRERFSLTGWLRKAGLY